MNVPGTPGKRSRGGYIIPGILAVLFILALGSGCLNQAFTPAGTIVYPTIQPVDEGGATLNPAWSFPFEGKTVTISFPVDAGVYRGATAAKSGVTVYGNVSDAIWIPGTYRHIMDDPAQDSFYRNLISAFREVRTSSSLDDDEYVELMASFVQSETYEIRNRTDPRFPVETYVDGSGDCDDKSLLLAGLLSREGYRVALLLFDPESHMAVGIADGTSGYDSTGYAYLETTSLSFVGIPPDSLRGNITLTSRPVVIEIGNGTKTYTKTSETRYIMDALKNADTRMSEMETDIASRETSLAAEKTSLDQRSRELSELLASGRYSQYNAGVTGYNSRVGAYNADLASYRTLTEEYNKMADLHNYIVTHITDRKGTYARVLNETG
ncbi:MAG: hypothetical protein ABFC24_00595 [Methanoregulaceae archaeon]